MEDESLDGYCGAPPDAARKVMERRKAEKRMFPDAGLGKPVRKFGDTFSAVTVLKKMFLLSR